MVANQSDPGWNSGLSSDSWWQRSAINAKFTDECVKNVLAKKMFPNGLNMGLPLWVWVEKTLFMEWKQTDSPVKKSSGHSGQ